MALSPSITTVKDLLAYDNPAGVQRINLRQGLNCFKLGHAARRISDQNKKSKIIQGISVKPLMIVWVKIIAPDDRLFVGNAVTLL